MSAKGDFAICFDVPELSDIIEVGTYIPSPASHLKNCRFSSTRLSKEILVPNVLRAVTTIRWNRSISVRVVGESGNEDGSEGRTTS